MTTSSEPSWQGQPLASSAVASVRQPADFAPLVSAILADGAGVVLRGNRQLKVRGFVQPGDAGAPLNSLYGAAPPERLRRRCWPSCPASPRRTGVAGSFRPWTGAGTPGHKFSRGGR